MRYSYFGLVVLVLMLTFSFGQASETKNSKTPSLRAIPVPEPANLSDFVKDKEAAIRLGKALFWDMQVGSDGSTACASCHFNAFGDNRVKNTIAPGVGKIFKVTGPNGTLAASNFPITSFLVNDRPGAELNPENPFEHNSDNVVSSQGVRLHQFINVINNQGFERGTAVLDNIFNVNGENIRRVAPRNTPTVINAVFNFSNFWDGRARNIFNGVNPFGELDEEARVFQSDASGIKQVQIRIPDSSLASQAVGPLVSDFEMSSSERTIPKIGKKLLPTRALQFQKVHQNDSVLGPFALPNKGLTLTYEKMIQDAFHDKWWKENSKKIKFKLNAKRIHRPDRFDPRTFPLDAGVPEIQERQGTTPLADDEYSLMEANFGLFFGLAVQLYESTLISDQSKWDKVQEGSAQFTPDELAGQTAFGTGRCGGCHLAPEFTSHSIRNIRNGLAPQAPGFLPNNMFSVRNTGSRQGILVDTGFMNIGVRPAGSVVEGFPGFVAHTEDVGRGGVAPTINPLTGKNYPLSMFRLAELKKQNLLPPGVALYIPDLPVTKKNLLPGEAEEIDGALKAPSLRNMELLGPYFHNGEAATLEQAIEFYTRGGNFPVTNIFNRDNGVRPITAFIDNLGVRQQLVAFLKTLTDERVRNEQAPFDHPEIFVPSGSPGSRLSLNCRGSLPRPGFHTAYCDEVIHIPAIGSQGRVAEGLPPLQSFLNLDPASPN